MSPNIKAMKLTKLPSAPRLDRRRRRMPAPSYL
jgi:hypothetical protein